MFDPAPTLEGSVITLTPLREVHSNILGVAATDLHKQAWSGVPSAEEMPAYVRERVAGAGSDRSLPLLVRLNKDARAVGVTGLRVDNPDVPSVQVAHTWIARGAQSTRVFPEILRLLLDYSFTTLGAGRVSFHVPRINNQARAALEKATISFEGMLRAATKLPTGSVDDVYVYSVLPHEYPALRDTLDYRVSTPLLPEIGTEDTPFAAPRPGPTAGIQPESEDLPAFRYHPHPVITGAIIKKEAECPCCDRTTGWAYAYRPYATERVSDLCPWCIASGAAAEKYDAVFIPSAPDGIPPERAEELMKRTPSFASYQEEEWQAADGDACQFLGVATADQLASLTDEERAESGLDPQFFSDDYLTWLRSQPREELRAYADPCVFAFASLHSPTLKFWMDHSA